MTTTFVSATDTYGEDNIVTITGATTTAVLSGFNITGTKGNFFLDSVTDVNICDNGPGGGTGTLGLGVFVEQGATATITNNIITHIHNYPYYPCAAYGIGIWVGRGGEASTPGTATISGNTIYDYQKSAIIVDGTESTATITGNTITGWSLAFQASVPGGIAQNGIQISRGAVATITSNTISVNECNSVLATSCGPGLEQDYASGIILYSSGPGTVVSKNTLSANDIGIVLVEADPSTTVSLNMLSANRYEGIYVNDGTNTVSGNMITGPGNVGIASVADSVNTVVTATGNHVTSTVTTPYEAFGESGYTASILISQLP
jgi:parallel beta-helix repeat protein